MNERLFKVLEFKKILTEIEKYAKADISKKRVLSIMPFTDYSAVQYELDKTDQALNIITSIGGIPTAPFESIDKSVTKAQKGGILSIAEFYYLKQFLKICINLLKYFSESALLKLNIDKILSIVSYINIDTSFARELDRIFLDKENIADNSTAELLKIRRDIKSAEADITLAVNSVLNNPSNRKYLSDTVPAMKNQRLTVPVRAEFKDAIKGVIHDISATGATVFIEPEKAFSLNNKLTELRVKEELEIEKILASLSESVSFISDDLLSSFDAVISLDIVFSKAQYALALNAVKPEITKEGNTCIYSARHPLIDKNKVVPSDIIFNDSYRVIVITGPNTGGKTVALKTLALICVMAQSGILIPAKEYSKVRVFKKIFADIGDEQSIEQSLSTFSSHMTNIIQILNQADDDTLIIIDEIGAGTD
ncbi:MAG: endonuclease MutS2, partial [Eubacteriaceae bacterium]|nr:endonuclease MutS2 [Eubacteriaceae bacterium]